jgi:hypothetical protein
MSRRAPLVAAVVLVVATDSLATQQRPTFSARTDAVSVHVSVKQRNLPVTGLGADDFELLDNGVRQRIDSVAVEAVPIDLTLFLDTSPSFSGRTADLKDDILEIAQRLRPEDRVRLLTFGTEVNDVFGWRPAGAPLDLETLRIGRVSPVNDGVFAALMHRPAPGRRHLVVAMTDGLDFGGAVTSSTVRQTAARVDAVLHLVLMASSVRMYPNAPFPWTPSQPEVGGEARLREAAELTGGRVHAPILRMNVVNAFTQAFEDFRTSYVLRYTPAGVAREGWHRIDVAVPGVPRATIRARRTYFGGS